MADPADQGDLVGLEAHPGAAAVARAATGQLAPDVLGGDGQAGGQPLDHHDEGLPVGLAGGQVPQHRLQRYPPGWNQRLAR